MLKKYCLGFIFSLDSRRILLQYKGANTPTPNVWNASCGGKIDIIDYIEEDPLDAMVRECKEETGIEINKRSWYNFCELTDNMSFSVECFYVFTNKISDYRQLESEKLEIHQVGLLPKTVSNLPFLIQMALNMEKGNAIKYKIVGEYKD